MKPWSQADAIALCRELEAICPPFGCHVALTGGLLYKDGERKDCDVLFYRIRDVDEIDMPGLFDALSKLDIMTDSGADIDEYGDDLWCAKMVRHGRPIDMFFPEVAVPQAVPAGSGTEIPMDEDTLP